MDNLDISQLSELSSEKLWQLALSWKSHQWTSEIGKLDLNQLPIVMRAVASEHDPLLWKEKLNAAIQGLNERPHLETVGKTLSIPQSIEILSNASAQPSVLDKLSPLLVGMPHEVFCGLLTNLSQDELAPLKQEALTEAVQHHLTLVAQELSAKCIAYQAKLVQKKQQLVELPLENLTHIDIDSINQTITELEEEGMLSLKTINCALAVAWNTMRSDLIEQLSKLKEHFQRIILFDVGHPKEETEESTGLRSTFEKRLDNIFSEPNLNSLDHIELLPDDVPALEALVKFGVWYIRDYWDIGLLPQIAKEQLEVSPGATPAQMQSHREKLFVKVNRNLEKIGLVTLADLKLAKIYSKIALKDYIRQHQEKLI